MARTIKIKHKYIIQSQHLIAMKNTYKQALVLYFVKTFEGKINCMFRTVFPILNFYPKIYSSVPKKVLH